jgi:hypothetical protein
MQRVQFAGTLRFCGHRPSAPIVRTETEKLLKAEDSLKKPTNCSFEPCVLG